MRILRLITAGVLAGVLAVALAVAPRAQQLTEEDYDKLMKGVGAANGAMRKAIATDATAAGAEARKLAELFKQAAAFWTARKNTEAAGWSTGAMTHALEIDKALTAKNTDSANEHAKQLAASCTTCHNKYRDKSETGYVIKKQ